MTQNNQSIVNMLRDLLREYGDELTQNPKRCAALLNDLCVGVSRREIRALMEAINEGMVADLRRKAKTAPLSTLMMQYTRKLHDGPGLDEKLARWAVETWAQVLIPNEFALELTGGVKLKLVRVPAGDFHMGSADSDLQADDREKPQHLVYLDEYYIGKYEVTNEQYAAYAQAKGIIWTMPVGKATHPVVRVGWDDAEAFCAWVSEVSRQKVRLPSESEWEKAARGTDGRKYPWGNEEPTCERANYRGCAGETLPVGSKPKGVSPYGALDMAGNVWQCVADWWEDSYYRNSPQVNPVGPASGDHRVLRGGSWDYDQLDMRAACRGWIIPDYRSADIGFRVVCDSVL